MENEFDKSATVKNKEHAPPISISLLEKAIIVSKRDRPNYVLKKSSETIVLTSK